MPSGKGTYGKTMGRPPKKTTTSKPKSGSKSSAKKGKK